MKNRTPQPAREKSAQGKNNHAKPDHAKIDQDKIDQAKLIYDAGVAPISEILKMLGMNAGQFRRFREKNGWPMRASACAPSSKQSKTSPAPATATRPLDAGGLIARLEDAVEREFAHAEAALVKHTPKTIEASARALASLVKTLVELKRLQRDADEARGDKQQTQEAADGANDDEPPRNMAELRTKLDRRLERLRGERTA